MHVDASRTILMFKVGAGGDDYECNFLKLIIYPFKKIDIGFVKRLYRLAFLSKGADVVGRIQKFS